MEAGGGRRTGEPPLGLNPASATKKIEQIICEGKTDNVDPHLLQSAEDGDW
jgi:hypothetical protein